MSWSRLWPQNEPLTRICMLQSTCVQGIRPNVFNFLNSWKWKGHPSKELKRPTSGMRRLALSRRATTYNQNVYLPETAELQPEYQERDQYSKQFKQSWSNIINQQCSRKQKSLESQIRKWSNTKISEQQGCLRHSAVHYEQKLFRIRIVTNAVIQLSLLRSFHRVS